MPNRKTARKSNAVTLFRPLRSQSASVKQLLTGTIAVVVSSNANGTVIPNSYVNSCTGWASYAADFLEYRVLAARVFYLPFSGRSGSLGTGSGLAAVYNVGSGGTSPAAPTSLGGVTDYHDDYVPIFAGRPFMLSWKAFTIAQKQQISISSVTNNGGFLTRLEGCTNGTIGNFIVQYVVEFYRS